MLVVVEVDATLGVEELLLVESFGLDVDVDSLDEDEVGNAELDVEVDSFEVEGVDEAGSDEVEVIRVGAVAESVEEVETVEVDETDIPVDVEDPTLELLLARDESLYNSKRFPAPQYS